jgi:hypothetical protein
MVAALELYFDPVAERRLHALWTALEAAGVATLANHTHGRHRPHISLAAADKLPPEPVVAAVGILPLPLTVTFQHVGQFPGGVLWLGPTPTQAMLALHRDTIARLDAGGIEIWPLYRPDVWVPHCTLSMAARSAAVAKALPLCFDILPMSATLDWAAVVDHTRDQFTPLRRVASAET